jgi:FkbM family methyltransferase
MRDVLATRPWLSRPVSRVATVVGARSVGAKLRQLSLDLVVTAVPAEAVGGRRITVKLPGRVGRDQIATALRESGWDGFEPPMPTVFAAIAASNPGAICDVGANTGLYSVIAAKVNTANVVYAFEPFPPVQEDLRSTLRANHCALRVQVEPIAVGSAAGVATLYVPVQDHGLVETSATLSPTFKDAYGEQIDVQVLTLDAFTDMRHTGRITVVKIDVESLEIEVLRGARRILKTHRPFVFCEVLPSGDAAGIDRLARQLRYTDIRLHPSEAIVGGTVAFDPEGWNHLLVPDEKLGRAFEVFERCGLSYRSANAD